MRRRKKENPASSAVAYARISSARRQLTINVQMGIIRKYAKRRGLFIVKEYADGLKGGGKR
jgi:predicted site-specific integrase-resolvase